MSRTRRIVPGVITVIGLSALAACAEPPVASIDAAHQAQQAAVDEGVAEYAPESLSEVTRVRAALDAELAAQDERMALRRSYDEAERLATELQTVSDRAVEDTRTARETVRNETTTLLADSRMALDSVNAMLVIAPAGKGSSADLAAFQTDLETAAQGLVEAETLMASGSFIEARSKATASREIIDRVKAAIEQAQQMRRTT